MDIATMLGATPGERGPIPVIDGITTAAAGVIPVGPGPMVEEAGAILLVASGVTAEPVASGVTVETVASGVTGASWIVTKIDRSRWTYEPAAP